MSGTENWKPVVGYEGLYEVSDLGRIRTLHPRWRKPRLLSPKPDERGRIRVTLYGRNGKQSRMFLHRVVLKAFVGPCPPGMEACHDPDPDPSNCQLSNLRWDTRSNNHKDCFRHGRAWIQVKPHLISRGEKSPFAKLTASQVREIRHLRAATPITFRELSARYGVSTTTVRHIVARRKWAHVD